MQLLELGVSMAEDFSPAPGSSLGSEGDLELLTRGDATQMVTDLVQLIEAKALAHRLAFKVLVQEVSTVAGPEVAFHIQARLDAMRLDPAILTDQDDSLRGSIAEELSLLVDELDSLVSGA
jgi:hypothetical protein